MTEIGKPRPCAWADYEDELYRLRKIAEAAGRLEYGSGAPLEDRTAIRRHLAALGVRDADSLLEFGRSVVPDISQRPVAQAYGVVRNIDELGRIVLPMGLRRNLGIDRGTALEVLVVDGAVAGGGTAIALRKTDHGRSGMVEFRGYKVTFLSGTERFCTVYLGGEVGGAKETADAAWEWLIKLGAVKTGSAVEPDEVVKADWRPKDAACLRAPSGECFIERAFLEGFADRSQVARYEADPTAPFEPTQAAEGVAKARGWLKRAVEESPR